MREIRPSGSEGGVTHLRHPYPYVSGCPLRDKRWRLGLLAALGEQGCDRIDLIDSKFAVGTGLQCPEEKAAAQVEPSSFHEFVWFGGAFSG